MNANFGLELRRLRGEAGMTLVDVAGRMGWSIVYLSDIERSRRNPPSSQDIQRLAEAMGVPDPETIARLSKLAAQSRQSIRIPVKEGDDIVNEMLVALARRADEGSIDTEIAERIRNLLEGGTARDDG